jgi:hypothetical protein
MELVQERPRQFPDLSQVPLPQRAFEHLGPDRLVGVVQVEGLNDVLRALSLRFQ